MQFGVRENKPKLYNALLLTAIMAIFFAVNHFVRLISSKSMIVLFVVYFLLMFVILLIAFFHQLQYNFYSYNTIFYVGFAIFDLFLLIVFTILLLGGEDLRDAHAVGMIASSACHYIIISFPFIILFSLGLCISNISLIYHEGFSFVNVLGIILAVLMVGGFFFIYRYDFYASGSLEDVMRHDIFANAFAAIYLYYECMLIGSIIADTIAMKYQPAYDKDFLIVLGCGLKKDGTPTNLLKGRLDRALEFYHKQQETSGKDLIFVASGGQGSDEAISESAAMKKYLVEKGIPESHILEENQSTNTYENMLYSKEKIEHVDPNGRVAFSTTNYHVFRSGICARRVKMKAEGMGAKTKWYFWPNAAVREFIGLLTEHKGKQAAIMIGLLVAYIAVTLLYYTYS